MRTDAEGQLELNETEKTEILEGLSLLSLYCESKLGCRGCPFVNDPFGCGLKNFMPCCWTIPTTWQGEEDKNE